MLTDTANERGAVEARSLRVRPRGSTAGQQREYDRRRRRAHFVVREAVAPQPAWRQVRDQHVCLRGQRVSTPRASGLPRSSVIDRFPPVVDRKRIADRIALAHGAMASVDVAVRRLHLHHVGAEVRRQRRAGGAAR